MPIAEELEAMRVTIESTKGVEASAKATIDGIAGKVAAAYQAGLDAGATPEQLLAFADLRAGLEQSSNELAASIAANP